MKNYFLKFLSYQPSNEITTSFKLNVDTLVAFLIGVGVTLSITILIYFMVKDFKKSKNDKNKNDKKNKE